MEKIFKTEIAGRSLVVETGKIAQFANGSVFIKYGDTTVLSTVTASSEPREGIDFFPLSVDYEEKMYAVGKIPGGFLKREGRPGEKAILTSRVIDRPIRPLFPKDLRNDVCVNNLVMSVDPDCSPEITSMIGTSIAIAISDIPWKGPVGGVVLGLIDNKAVINPTLEQRQESQMYVTLAGTLTKICMVEAGANEVPDDIMLAAIAEGHEVIKQICAFINSIVAEIGKPKFEYQSADVPEEVFAAVKEFGWDKMRQAVLSKEKEVRDANVAALQNEVAEMLETREEGLSKWAADSIYKLEKKVVRDYLFREHIRVDGRALDEIRPLSCAVDIVPRVHGSSLFQRGQTQVMNICTLAPLAEAQKLEGLDEQDYKRYIHHYNFPGYSTGEAKPSRSPGRREIGHGALAERSLIPVLPSEEEFPYAIRTVSEIAMSNGSTSQGSVCASTLSLMAAGVPIKRPVAGISSGLIVNEDNDSDFLVFMDIQGIEDFFGDMDFKVAGTTEGITSIQVDIKVEGLSLDIIREAFAMTHKGRLQIINDVILPCIPAPRKELNEYAPRIITVKVPVDKIRDVIGSGGKVINKIIADTGANININEDGTVFISTANLEAAEKAKMIINGIVSDPEVGTEYDGTVTRLMDFGAFVEFLPGKEGLVHISKMAWNRVEKVEDVLHEGDKVHVKLIEIDSQGRLNLSIRDCLPKPDGYVEEEPRRREMRPDRERRGSYNGGRREGGFGGGRRDGGRPDRAPRRYNNEDTASAGDMPTQQGEEGKGRRREF
jgi:polyribonucleotide nucleotidyltransferase